MSVQEETFFTAIGCMDGRVQHLIALCGQEKFGAKYPDTITEAGLVGQLAKGNPELEKALSFKAKTVSLEKHASKGIVVHGHQECAGNPVDDAKHKQDILTSVEKIKTIVGHGVDVIGVFVKRSSNPSVWEAETLV